MGRAAGTGFNTIVHRLVFSQARLMIPLVQSLNTRINNHNSFHCWRAACLLPLSVSRHTAATRPTTAQFIACPGRLHWLPLLDAPVICIGHAAFCRNPSTLSQRRSKSSQRTSRRLGA